MEHGTCISLDRSRRRACLGLVSLALALLASSCSTVSVRTDRSSLIRSGIESAEDLQKFSCHEEHSDILHEIGESCILLLKEGNRHEMSGRHADAAGCYLSSAVAAREHLVAGNAGPRNHCRDALVDLHNRSLARFAELWSNDPRRLSGKPYLFTCRDENFEIVLGTDSDFKGDFFDRAVSAEAIRGKGIAEQERDGYGAALVAIREQTKERADELKFYPAKGMHVPVTLTVSDVRETAQRKVVSLSLHDCTRRETIQVGPNRFPLAADFAAPLELLLEGQNELISGLTGFMDAKSRARDAGIYLLEPYDPERIPVILSHGLISVPIIWRDIIPACLSDPAIARRYQFFVFTYPSSYPILDSALLFRNQLAELRAKYDPGGRHPLSRNVVAVGHSMGGILTRLLITDIENHWWDQVAPVPFSEFKGDAEQRELLQRLMFFEPDPGVRRAVFISTPHGGAKLATMSIANNLSRLARLPTDVLKVTASFTQAAKMEGFTGDFRKKITSVQSLHPDSPVVMALKSANYRKGVVYHSIIGDRGKGDSPDSSDGIVDYWSSHQPGAASELIVPTGHPAYQHPKAIEELRRILRAHAGL